MATTEQANKQIALPSGEKDEDKVDALDILLVLAHRRRLIGIVTLATTIVGIALALFLKPNFTATALILPPEQEESSASALMGTLGALSALSGAGGGGASAALGLKSPGDMYVGILGSRTIADNIIDAFHLKDRYKRKTMAETEKALDSHSDLTSEKDGLISIAVTDHDPRVASDLANAYISELYKMNASLATSEAAQRRVFFDHEVAAEKTALNVAEENMRDLQQRTGLIQLTGQAEMIIQSIADLRARIQASEVTLQATQTFATDQNPDVLRLQQQIATMQGQLAKLENDQSRIGPGDIAVPAGQVPQDILEYSRTFREVKYHEDLYELLSRQYEAARIDEAKSAPVIQVVDYAVPPDKRSGPKRSLILLGSILIGLICSCLWVLCAHGFRSMRDDPRTAEKVARLQATMRQRT
jgi:uncharacterized protein involved in exopolysaccharide biosynthesis